MGIMKEAKNDPGSKKKGHMVTQHKTCFSCEHKVKTIIFYLCKQY